MADEDLDLHAGNVTPPEQRAWETAITLGMSISRAELRALLQSAVPGLIEAGGMHELIVSMLGSDHYVTFGDDRFTIEHSAECRLSGQMADCPYHDAVSLIAGRDLLGRWRITGIDLEGLPDMERADG